MRNRKRKKEIYSKQLCGHWLQSLSHDSVFSQSRYHETLHAPKFNFVKFTQQSIKTSLKRDSHCNPVIATEKPSLSTCVPSVELKINLVKEVIQLPTMDVVYKFACLLVCLMLLDSSEAAVQCQNMKGSPVDWYECNCFK